MIPRTVTRPASANAGGFSVTLITNEMFVSLIYLDLRSKQPNTRVRLLVRHCKYQTYFPMIRRLQAISGFSPIVRFGVACCLAEFPHPVLQRTFSRPVLSRYSKAFGFFLVVYTAAELLESRQPLRAYTPNTSIVLATPQPFL
ncbi:unnamed protein product [Soboliphyme baturini]|uniref:Uncharacterized protein n=1 Tax=Soboliphyme baturini TaxID=241478 RepID=A0A183IZM6_9BILA|nr:unnamed protein product [Soboliphyme baturini]